MRWSEKLARGKIDFMKYAMFMRGVNVGGIKVPMAELQECLRSLGLENIKTFLQTGNVVLESPLLPEELKPTIDDALSKRFNYRAFVLVYPASLLTELVHNYPFDTSERKHRYIVFCDNQAIAEELAVHQPELDPDLEKVALGNKTVYWSVDKGRTLDAGFSKILAKPKYKSQTTNRNINTVEKMINYLSNDSL